MTVFWTMVLGIQLYRSSHALQLSQVHRCVCTQSKIYGVNTAILCTRLWWIVNLKKVLKNKVPVDNSCTLITLKKTQSCLISWHLGPYIKRTKLDHLRIYLWMFNWQLTPTVLECAIVDRFEDINWKQLRPFIDTTLAVNKNNAIRSVFYI